MPKLPKLPGQQAIGVLEQLGFHRRRKGEEKVEKKRCQDYFLDL